MNTYKLVTPKELAKFIETMPCNEEFFFADTWDEETSVERLDGSCCEGWWGIKKIKAFDSLIVIFGWSGGGQTWCTEVNNEYLEDDIKHYLKDYVEGTTIENFVVLEMVSQEGLIMKQLWRTRYNGSNILVKAEQEDMERLFQEDKISDYTLAKVYKVKEI